MSLAIDILLVVADPNEGRFIEAMLPPDEFNVSTVNKWDDGLFMASVVGYDLILLDTHFLNIGVRQGIHLLWDDDIYDPVIVLSENGDLKEMFADGCSGFLKKPFSKQALLSCIRACF